MSFAEIVTYPYYFFIDLITTYLSEFAPFYTVIGGLVILGLVMLVCYIVRRK